MSNVDRPEAGGSRANTIIAALASVLGAVILAGGTIIASANRAKDVAQNQSGELMKQLATTKHENESLRAENTTLQEQLKKAGGRAPVATDSQEVDGFQFTRPQCRRSGMIVICKFDITNDAGTRRLRPHARPDLFHNSRALTDQGPLVHANGAVLAGIEGSVPELSVPSRVTVPASIKFQDVAPEVNAFTVLTIGFEIDISDYEVEFRDIQIQ